MSRWKQVSSLVHNKTLVSSLGVSFQAVSFAHTVSCACTSPELLACWPVAVMSYYSFCSLFIYVCKRIYFFVCLFAYLAIFSFEAVSVPLLSSLCLFSSCSLLFSFDRSCENITQFVCYFVHLSLILYFLFSFYLSSPRPSF